MRILEPLSCVLFAFICVACGSSIPKYVEPTKMEPHAHIAVETKMNLMPVFTKYGGWEVRINGADADKDVVWPNGEKGRATPAIRVPVDSVSVSVKAYEVGRTTRKSKRLRTCSSTVDPDCQRGHPNNANGLEWREETSFTVARTRSCRPEITFRPTRLGLYVFTFSYESHRCELTCYIAKPKPQGGLAVEDCQHVPVATEETVTHEY